MTKPPALLLAIPADGDGNSVHNKILLSLSSEDSDRVLPKLEFVHLKLHQVLHEAGQTIKSGYFVNDGMISVLAVHPDGKSVEVGLIGNEGFAGLPLIVGFRTSPTRLITQGDGSAYRCDAETLLQLIRKVPTLERQLHRFGQRLILGDDHAAKAHPVLTKDLEVEIGVPGEFPGRVERLCVNSVESGGETL